MAKLIFPFDIVGAGIYVIHFSNGDFYIGSTNCFKNRFRTHSCSIKSKFTTAGTCRAFFLMKGFELDASFEILKVIDISELSRMDGIRTLLQEESKILLTYKKDKKCLNWNRKAYRRQILVKCL